MRNRELIETELTRNQSKRSNSLIYARYELGSIAQDILQVTLAQIKNEDKAIPIFRMSLYDLEAKFGKRIREANIKVAAKELKTSDIIFKEGTRVDNFSWCSRFTYDMTEKYIEIKLDDELHDHLISLLDRFTVIQDKYFFDLKSKYSKRLYSIFVNQMDLALSRGSKEANYKTSTDNLIFTVSAPDSFKKNFNGLKTRVIETAIKEINEHSDLNIKASYKKEGKKVKTITFSVTEKTERIVDRKERKVKSNKVQRAKAIKEKVSRDNNNNVMNTGVSAVQSWLVDNTVEEVLIIEAE